MNVHHIYDIENMSIDELCEQLRVWAYSYQKYESNYDAALLLKVARILEEMQFESNTNS